MKRIVLPLLLGPWLTRLYSPSEFGQFATVWTVAANLAVIGCARYEFALPLESDEGQAARLMALCLRLLGVVFAAAADDPQTGFALSAKEASSVVSAGRTATAPTGTGGCAQS